MHVIQGWHWTCGKAWPRAGAAATLGCCICRTVVPFVASSYRCIAYQGSPVHRNRNHHEHYGKRDKVSKQRAKERKGSSRPVVIKMPRQYSQFEVG